MRAASAVVLSILCGLFAGTAHGATPESAISVATSRTNVATTIGERFSFTTTVTNGADAPTEPLVANLNVVGLQEGVYVDPEDWSGNRTRYLGRLTSGEERVIDWRVQAVTSGGVALYVTVLPQSGAGRRSPTSPVLRVEIARRSTIDTGGALGVALGVPAALALLAAAGRLSRRRRVS